MNFDKSDRMFDVLFVLIIFVAAFVAIAGMLICRDGRCYETEVQYVIEMTAVPTEGVGFYES